MGNTRFTLSPLKDNSKESIVWIYATWNSKRLRLSTEVRIKNSLWTGEKIKGNGFGLENKKLYEIITTSDKTISDYQLNSKILTVDALKNELLKIISPDRAIIKSGIKQYNLQTFIEEYIATNPQNLKPDTIEVYQLFLKNKLLPFAKKFGKHYLSFESVNMEWDELFTKFCAQQGDSRNTIDKHQKTVKKIMRYSFDKEKHTNTKYTSIKRSQEQTDSIYLTEEEIMDIYKLNFFEPYLNNAKDLFVFSCFTGLRISDLLTMEAADWRDNAIYIKPKKTEKAGDKPLKIPLRKTALEILKKYKGNFPSIIEQDYNKYLKKICCNIPALCVNISTYYTKGMNERIKEINRKWELVSSHTGRRSFATNEYRRKSPLFHIMAITGHKKVETFMKYIKITQEDMADDMQMDFSKRPF